RALEGDRTAPPPRRRGGGGRGGNLGRPAPAARGGPGAGGRGELRSPLPRARPLAGRRGAELLDRPVRPPPAPLTQPHSVHPFSFSAFRNTLAEIPGSSRTGSGGFRLGERSRVRQQRPFQPWRLMAGC